MGYDMARERNEQTTSADLVREATGRDERGRRDDGPAGWSPEEFRPTSPSDTYRIERADGASLASEPQDPTTAQDDGDAGASANDDLGALSATEVAELLAQQTDDGSPPPSADPEPPVVEAPSPSLPEWAVGDSRSSRPTSDTTTPVAERIRELSSTSPDTPDTRTGGPPRPEFEGDRWSTSTPEWEARPKPEPRRRDIPIPSLRVLVGVVFLIVMLVGLISSALDGRQAVDSIEVGDCFVAGDALEIDQVPVVGCAEPHDSELFDRVTLTGFGAAYPGDEEMFDWLFAECVTSFPSYVGEPYDTSEYYIDMFVPTSDGWAEGDRTGLCTLVVLDDDLNIRTNSSRARGSGANA